MDPIKAYTYTLEWLTRSDENRHEVVNRIEQLHIRKGELLRHDDVALETLSPEQQKLAKQIAKTHKIAQDASNRTWQAILYACADYQEDRGTLSDRQVTKIHHPSPPTQAEDAIVGTSFLVSRQREAILQQRPASGPDLPKYALYKSREEELRAETQPSDIFKKIDRKAIAYHMPDFDVRSPHTMSMRDYLNARFSLALQTKIAFADEIEIFQGSERDFASYYQGKKCTTYINPSSYGISNFLYYKDGIQKEKVVFYNVMSQARTNNTILLIKYIKHQQHGKFDTPVCIRGDIEQMLSEKAEVLATTMQSQISYAQNTLVIGARERPSRAAQEMAFRPQQAEVKVGEFKYDILISETKNRGMVALRMPNGDLAYHAMQKLLQTGKFDRVIMVGAGGALPKTHANVGDYCVVTRAEKDGHSVTIPSHHTVVIPQGNYIKSKHPTNITVDSPLEENQQWLQQHQEVGSVDVETFHILRAIEEYASPLEVTPGIFPSLQITPGLFISDVVGEYPLTEKIDTENAWIHLQDMIIYLLQRN